ncbi:MULTISPECIES: RidA family protein [Niastella]|uniref:RidA family protein n=1 Tax=Niastella soli TaxID=2821487 RepID=A0ABS3YUJ4_9BACT|nr:RidA family protein [Niastella soli]MBO9201591.1 RidA family protein [Niastella soli]
MKMQLHNPENLFPPYRNYSHAVQVNGSASLLFISGLNGYLSNGIDMPEGFEEQAELIWQHMGVILNAAGMSYAHLVSLRFYLADPSYDEANVKMLMKYLGSHSPARTVICCPLLDKRWKLEIEAVAAQ